MDKQLIYDVGMCDGSDTAHYLSKGFRVVSIEANPVLAERGKRIFDSAIKSGQLTILNIGIDERTGNIPFYVNERRAEWSSFVKEIGCRNGTPCHSILVNSNRMEDVLKQYGVPYYLKIDIEGHDHLCLLGIQSADLPQYELRSRSPRMAGHPLKRDTASSKLINQADGFKAVSLSREQLPFRILT
jgi:FkbM family methyltransferase